MASEKTLAALTVKIGANIEAFSSGLAKAEKRLAKMERNFKKTGEQLSKNLTLPFAAFAGVAFKAFAEEENALNKLSAQLRMNGKDVKTVMPQYQSFATEIQKTTRIADDAAFGLLQLAESMGAPNAKKATQDAIGLNAALGIDMEKAVKIATAAQMGNFTMLNRYVPALRVAKSETEKAAIAQKLFADGFNIAKVEAQGGLGPLIQMKNTLSDLMESFGAIVATAINPFISKLKELAEKFTALPQSVKENILLFGGIVAAVGPAVFAISKIIGAVKGVVTAFKAMSVFLAANPFTIWVVAIGALITGIVILWKKCDTFRAVVKFTAQSIAVFFQKAWIGIKEGAELMWLAIKTYFTAIPQAAAAIWNIIKRVMKGENIGDAIKEEFGKIITNVGDQATAIRDKYSEELSKIESPDYEKILAAEKAKGAAKDAGEITANAFMEGLSGVSYSDAIGESNAATKRDKTPMTSMTSKSATPLSGGLNLGLADAVGLETKKLKANSEQLLQTATQMKTEVGKVFVDLGEVITSSLGNAFVTLGESIGALASGTSSIGDVFKSLLGVILDFCSSLGKALIAAGIGAMSFKKLLASPWLAIAAGTALVALSAVVSGLLSKGTGSGSGGDGGSDIKFSNVPALASGGIATRPTLSMIGDSKNSMPNPEAIIPLNKLNGMLGAIQVTGRIVANGRDLAIIIENEKKRQSNLG